MAVIKSFSMKILEANLKVNESIPSGEYNLNYQLGLQKDMINGNEYAEYLSFDLVNSLEHPTPLNIHIIMKVIFNFDDVKGDVDKKEINSFLSLQGLQMVFPYLRSTITNLTSGAMLPPLILPIGNVRTMFKEIDIKKTLNN